MLKDQSRRRPACCLGSELVAQRCTFLLLGLASLSSRAAAVVLKSRSAADVKGCETVTVSAGYLAVSGTYVATGEHGGRKMYTGPGGATLRYEYKTIVKGNATNLTAIGNYGSDTWLNESGWFIQQGGVYRYGLTTTKPVFQLSGAMDWKLGQDGASPITVECSACISAPDWTNGVDCLSQGGKAEEGCTSDGYTCAGYVLKGWCSGGSTTALAVSFLGGANKYPEQNCCGCGGSWEPPMDTVLSQLDEEEKSITNFEAQIAGLHRGIAEAEQVLVNTTRLAQKARDNLRALQNTTGTNFHLLENMTMTLETLQAAMNLENTGLAKGINRTGMLLNTSKGLADDAKAIANETTLASLEVLGKKVWEASELTGENSMFTYEKRVKTAEEDESAFEGRLLKRVRAILSKRLRRNVNVVRREVRRLGNCNQNKEASEGNFLRPRLDTEAPSTGGNTLNTFQPCNELDDDFEDFD
eukprot:TRINITY_DN122224_c0_g1_i1.p1 TRINITY_DN122224_c0_g1~~TRINITY_DN122224_c0_g1_i1.p1  ORF type:complete len:508 (+),score=68.98 TRINITY_DN122224_c0_g1_i1:113-1525(+)